MLIKMHLVTLFQVMNTHIGETFSADIIYWGTKVWNIDINSVVIKKQIKK